MLLTPGLHVWPLFRFHTSVYGRIHFELPRCLCVSMLAAALALALLRERRLRRAVETLLTKLFRLWRIHHVDDPLRPPDPRDHRPDATDDVHRL